MQEASLTLSESLARRVCDEYAATVAADRSHPLRSCAGEMVGEGESASALRLFAEDVAELVGLALAGAGEEARDHVAAQSARRALDARPEWSRAASDWASGANLDERAFAALRDWLAPAARAKG